MNRTFKADRARPGLGWNDPYRPNAEDVCLDGMVTAAPVSYQCRAGDEIEAIQLTCNQLLGDYSGYSGSPLMRDYPDGSQGVLGILIEQRSDLAPEAQRGANVLIGTSVARPAASSTVWTSATCCRSCIRTPTQELAPRQTRPSFRLDLRPQLAQERHQDATKQIGWPDGVAKTR